MKTLIALTTILVAGFATAADVNSSWDDVARAYDVQDMSVSFNTSTNTSTSLSILDVCYLEEGDMLRSAEKVEVFNREGAGKQGPQWVSKGEEYVVASRTYSRTFCNSVGKGDNCSRTWTVDYAYPLEGMFDVYANDVGAGKGDKEPKLMFSKGFSVPNCQ